MAKTENGKAKTKAPKKPKSRLRKILGRVGVTALIIFIVGGLTGIGTFAYLYATTDLPDANADFKTDTTFIYYDDSKTEMGKLAVQNRVTLEYKDMPELMKQAVVAAENRTFWTDPGFSVSGMTRGLYSIATGGEIQGGSTITQQYIKILYLDSEKRISRKLNELILSMKMGREMPKEDILEGYLNTIYFGRGAYGIQAAAQAFFQKDAKDLNLQQAASLAAILNNPRGFSPSGGEEARKRLLDRYQYVLDGMVELGYITKAESDAVHNTLPEFPEMPKNDRYGGPKGFLLSMVERELADLGFPEEQVEGGGLRVTTTINKKMNDQAVKSAQTYTKKAAEKARDPQDPNNLHVAIASIDTATGGIKAAYGGPDYVKSQRNWATTDRPAASTFKAFATAAALENGFSMKTELKGNTYTPRGEGKPVRNAGGAQYGPVSLSTAVTKSINTAFVDLAEKMEDGPNKVIDAANRAGAPKSTDWIANNRVVLGTAQVSPINMANSYATLANDGKRNDAHIVSKVTSRTGEVLYEAKPSEEEAIDSNVAANVTQALTTVVDDGTAQEAATLDRPVAGKTGTHQVEDETQAGWFVGYTKQLSTAVMYVAGDAGTGDLKPYRPRSSSQFYGGGWPLKTWVDYMEVATEGMEKLDFTEAKRIRASSGVTETSEPEETARSEQPRSERPSSEPSPSQSESSPSGGTAPSSDAVVPSETPTPDQDSSTPSGDETSPDDDETTPRRTHPTRGDGGGGGDESSDESSDESDDESDSGSSSGASSGSGGTGGGNRQQPGG